MEALNRFPFYLLPNKKQKMFEFILKRIQNGASVRMGPFRRLDYAAATQVIEDSVHNRMIMGHFEGERSHTDHKSYVTYETDHKCIAK